MAFWRARNGSSGKAAAASSRAAEALSRVRRLELRTRWLVDSILAGEYRSIFTGRGMEFSHVRLYQPGDDIRLIDWKVTARRGGTPYIRQFVEERDLVVMLVVDISGSGVFGPGERAVPDVAAEIAAALAFAAVRNNDRVGLLLVSDRVERFLPPRAGRQQALRILMEMAEFRAEGSGTRPSEGFLTVTRVLPRRCVVAVISDFILDATEFPAFRREAMALAARHDVIPIQLIDPTADAIPDAGMMTIQDPETGRMQVVDTGNPEFRRAFEARVSGDRRRLAALFRELRWQPVELDIADGGLDPLLRYFRLRNAAAR
jgi:uncharacterized protein (DUF58 family)